MSGYSESQENERIQQTESIYSEDNEPIDSIDSVEQTESTEQDKTSDSEEGSDALYSLEYSVDEDHGENYSDVEFYNKTLKKEVANDENLSSMFSNEQLEMIDSDVTPRGYSWNVDRVSGTVQLVKTADLEREREFKPDTSEQIKSIVDQNVQEYRLPNKNGHWTDSTKVGNCMWIPDDDAEFSWEKDGETHHMTYGELKDKYNIEGVMYRNKLRFSVSAV